MSENEGRFFIGSDVAPVDIFVPPGNYEYEDGCIKCKVPKCKYSVKLLEGGVIKNERSFGRLVSNFRKHLLKHEAKVAKTSKS